MPFSLPCMAFHPIFKHAEPSQLMPHTDVAQASLRAHYIRAENHLRQQEGRSEYIPTSWKPRITNPSAAVTAGVFLVAFTAGAATYTHPKVPTSQRAAVDRFVRNSFARGVSVGIPCAAVAAAGAGVYRKYKQFEASKVEKSTK